MPADIIAAKIMDPMVILNEIFPMAFSYLFRTKYRTAVDIVGSKMYIAVMATSEVDHIIVVANPK